MRKFVLSMVFLLITVVLNAQESKIIAKLNDASDVTSFDLDCT